MAFHPTEHAHIFAERFRRIRPALTRVLGPHIAVQPLLDIVSEYATEWVTFREGTNHYIPSTAPRLLDIHLSGPLPADVSDGVSAAWLQTMGRAAYCLSLNAADRSYTQAWCAWILSLRELQHQHQVRDDDLRIIAWWS